MRIWAGCGSIRVLQRVVAGVAILGGAGLGATSALANETNVSALGRIEPADGVIRIAGPSGPGSVIAKLEAREGGWVEAGQVLARLDSHRLRKAEVAKIRAQLANAKRELARVRKLSKDSATSIARLDGAELVVAVAEADLASGLASLELTRVRAPVRGQVLEIHTQPGERIGLDGVLELGQTDRMYAVAEVYETDIARVAPGHAARIKTSAIPDALSGTVERVGLKVGKMDVLATDPIAKADARVVEVFILLDEGEAVSKLTNLQVEVEIMSGTPKVATGP